jgi:hypothetical protein
LARIDFVTRRAPTIGFPGTIARIGATGKHPTCQINQEEGPDQKNDLAGVQTGGIVDKGDLHVTDDTDR